MAKKELQQGLAGLLTPTQEQAQPKEQKQEKKQTKTACYNLPVELLDKLREVAYIDRRNVSAIVAIALEEYFTRWEEQKGK